jgi:long-chain acyl-CoA synthetase
MDGATLSDLLIAIAGRHPERMAIESPATALTYGDLIARSSQSARELLARGIRPGENVGIALRDSGQSFLFMCALWMVGAVPVPMDFRTRHGEKSAAAAQFDLAAILEDRPAPEDAGYRAILVEPGWFGQVARHPRDPLYSSGLHGAALIALTSGTTGKKLGVVVDHDVLLARAGLPAGLGARDAGGRLLNPSPLSFTASVHSTVSQLLNGGTVVYFAPVFSVQELSDAIAEKRATSVCTVPTVVRGLLDLHQAARAPVFPQLNFFYCAGAPLNADEKKLALRLLSPRFIEIYAATLVGRICFLDSPDIESHAESVGRVLPEVDLQIVDANDKVLPAGEHGFIRLKSPGMARSVYGGAQRDRGDRVRDGWVYTGDVGCLDADNFLQILGRDSDMLIRGGENVYPAEIEAVALEFKGVREVAVVGYSAPVIGEDLAAFFVADDPAATEQALLAHFRSRLIPNKTPRVVKRLDSLPRNENGKVATAVLKAMASTS